MIRAEIITPWAGSGAEQDPNRPRLFSDHVVSKWEDVTGQSSANIPPESNMYIVLAECEESVMAQIETDNAYQVLWSEEIFDVE